MEEKVKRVMINQLWWDYDDDIMYTVKSFEDGQAHLVSMDKSMWLSEETIVSYMSFRGFKGE